MTVEVSDIKDKYLILNPTIEEVKNPTLQSFYKLWTDVRKKSVRPTLDDFTPELIRNHIDDLAFLEYHPESQRFKIVEMGKNIIDVLGNDVLDQYWDTMPGSEEGQARMSWAVANKLPYYVGWPIYKWGRKPDQKYSALCCPVFDYEGDVEALLMVFSRENDNSDT